MAKRKPLSKSTRFEVFKRDRFTCQYCGAKAPDVLLEVDHIKPVAKGGTDDLMNLITACRDCNRGKRDRELTDDSIIRLQNEQLEELAERKEQLEMMLEWREELDDMWDDAVNAVKKKMLSYANFKPKPIFSAQGKDSIKNLLKEYSIDEVYEGIEIAFSKYPAETLGQYRYALRKIPGICYFQKKNDRHYYYFNYLKKALIGMGFEPDDNFQKLKDKIFEKVHTDEDFKDFRDWLLFGIDRRE